MKIFFAAFATFLLLSMANAFYNDTLAIEYIKSKQLTDGSFDPFSSPNSAAGVLALYKNQGNSSNVSAGIGYLKSDLENPLSYSWSEADIPSLALLTYAGAADLSDLNLSGVINRLLSMQGSGGGFRGYSQCLENCSDPDWTKQVWAASEDSVSTSLAILALVASNSSNESISAAATAYLLRLQNSDGSFNLTQNDSLGSLWSLGPDIISQTAWALLALKAAGRAGPENTLALAFLVDNMYFAFNQSNLTFAPALASLALEEYGDSINAQKSAGYLLCRQNNDGGYRDPSRFGADSTVLDTAFAALALHNRTFDSSGCDLANQSINPSPSPSPTPSPSPSPSVIAYATPTPTAQPSSSSSNGGNFNPPAPSPSKKPSPSPSPAASAVPSPLANKKTIQEEPSPMPTPKISVKPTMNKNPPAKKDGAPVISPSAPPAPNPATGLFAGGNANIAYAAIILVILGAAYIFVRMKK